MDLQGIIVTNVARAKQELGNLVIDFSLKKKTGSTYVNGVNTPVYSSVTVQGLYNQYADSEVDGTMVKNTDTKVILFIDSQDAIPEMGDLLVDGSNSYQVVKPTLVYAGNKVVLSTTQVRL